jgi:hypothetical protein
MEGKLRGGGEEEEEEEEEEIERDKIVNSASIYLAIC